MAVVGLWRCRLPHLPSNPEGTRVTLAAAQATSGVSCSLPPPRPALDCTSSLFISDPRSQGKRWGSLVRKILLLPRDTTTAVLAAGQGWLQCHLQGCSGGSSPGWGPALLLLPSTSQLLQRGSRTPPCSTFLLRWPGTRGTPSATSQQLLKLRCVLSGHGGLLQLVQLLDIPRGWIPGAAQVSGALG